VKGLGWRSIRAIPLGAACAWRPADRQFRRLSSRPQQAERSIIMIWWRGHGFWVLFIVGGVVLGTVFAFGALMPDAPVTAGNVPLGVGLLMAGLACYPLGEFTRKRQGAVLDGEMALDAGHHSLFFIPVHFFPWLLGAGGLVVCIRAVMMM
jgi:hypothetical protein